MANHSHDDGKVLGMGRTFWGWVSTVTVPVILWNGSEIVDYQLQEGHRGLAMLLAVTLLLLSLAALLPWILASMGEGQAPTEQEERKEIQELLSSPDSASRLTSDPELYRRAQAELESRREEALKMQELNALRQQVEEEERKAGIFAPNLSPARPQQADPMAAQMAQLARRRIEADRQKHLMKSLRNVEDAEWEADDV